MPAVSAEEPLFGFPKANLAILSQQGFAQKLTILSKLEGLKLTSDYFMDRAWAADQSVLNLNTENFFTPTGVPVSEKPAVAYWINTDATIVWVLSCTSANLGYKLSWTILSRSTQRGMLRAEPGEPKMSDCTRFAVFGGWSPTKVITAEAEGLIFVLAAKFKHQNRGGEMLMMQCQELPVNVASAFGM